MSDQATEVDDAAAAAPPPLSDVRDVVAPDAVGMVVLDLDGTCLDLDQQLHPRIAEAVRAASARVPVVIATGRMYRSAVPWARRLGVTAPVICYQGAFCADLPDEGAVRGTVHWDERLRGAAVQAVITVARTNGWHRQVFRDDHCLCEEDRPEANLYAKIAGVEFELVSDLYTTAMRGGTKTICVIDDSAEVRRCRTLLELTLGEEATVTRSLPQFVEVTNPKGTKALAVSRLRALLGIEGAVVAVGDAPNDAGLLDAADLGVAVRSDDHELLPHAQATCAPPQDGGVADVLESLGLA
jgi:Cof subfamily protein (haloacid dehalogenase superfamily)